MSEYTPDGPLVIEGIIEDGEFRQTNGQSFAEWIAAHDRQVEKRGATAALLCERDTSWEHHDQTDDFPCARCLNRADHIEGATDE